MPSRYRRPVHENGAIERTFSQDLEIERGWRIDYNRDRKIFIFTCKRGMQMPKTVPQGKNVPGLGQLLNGIIHDHDYTPGHGKAE